MSSRGEDLSSIFLVLALFLWWSCHPSQTCTMQNDVEKSQGGTSSWFARLVPGPRSAVEGLAFWIAVLEKFSRSH